MDWNNEALMAMRVVIAAILGGAVGWEREWHGREAGVRTFGAVAVGACVFALIATHISSGNNPHVVAAGVVTGVGFLGAGTISKTGNRIEGLTTAGALWSSAAVGLSVGYGMYLLAVLVAAILFGLLYSHHLPGWDRLKRHRTHAGPVRGAAPDCDDQGQPLPRTPGR